MYKSLNMLAVPFKPDDLDTPVPKFDNTLEFPVKSFRVLSQKEYYSDIKKCRYQTPKSFYSFQYHKFCLERRRLVDLSKLIPSLGVVALCDANLSLLRSLFIVKKETCGAGHGHIHSHYKYFLCVWVLEVGKTADSPNPPESPQGKETLT